MEPKLSQVYGADEKSAWDFLVLTMAAGIIVRGICINPSLSLRVLYKTEVHSTRLFAITQVSLFNESTNLISDLNTKSLSFSFYRSLIKLFK